MEEPKIEIVLRNIYDLYDNPDTSSKEKASKWLEDFQKSVSSQKLLHSLDFHSIFNFFFRFTHGRFAINFCSKKMI